MYLASLLNVVTLANAVIQDAIVAAAVAFPTLSCSGSSSSSSGSSSSTSSSGEAKEPRPLALNMNETLATPTGDVRDCVPAFGRVASYIIITIFSQI